MIYHYDWKKLFPIDWRFSADTFINTDTDDKNGATIVEWHWLTNWVESGFFFFFELRTHSHYHWHTPICQSFRERKLPRIAFITHEMTLIESVNSEKCGGKMNDAAREIKLPQQIFHSVLNYCWNVIIDIDKPLNCT